MLPARSYRSSPRGSRRREFQYATSVRLRKQFDARFWASLWLPRCFRYETYDESSCLDDAGRRNGLENALLQVTIAQDSRAGSSVCGLAAGRVLFDCHSGASSPLPFQIWSCVSDEARGSLDLDSERVSPKSFKGIEVPGLGGEYVDDEVETVD